MFKVGNTYIQADTLDIIRELKDELAKKGVERFARASSNGDNVQTNCPFHKDGQEKRPSFGINSSINKCHCFTCGWAGGIDDMISELFGHNDLGKFGRKWLIKKFNTVEIETRKAINFKFNRNKNMYKKRKKIITDKELDAYAYYHPYMFERGLTKEIIDRFDIGYNSKDKSITFPVRDLDGDCIFVAERKIQNKFFMLPSDVDKPVYLAYLFNSGKYKKAYITESFFNCLTLWKLGLPAMALMGTGSFSQYEILKKLPVREYVLALDPDKWGIKGAKRLRKNVNNKVIKEIIYQDDSKDINDLQEDFLKLEEVF